MENKTRLTLKSIYQKLYQHFGPQNWWPAQTALEMMVGAILTQNTQWKNVEKAILNLKKDSLLSLEALDQISLEQLAEKIRPAGFFSLKARRLKNLVSFLKENDFDTLNAALSTAELRKRLLAISGIGPETADSILLYAFQRPVFVVDQYTYRLLYRHGLVSEETDYASMQQLFIDHLEPDVGFYNEYHAQVVQVGKEFCRKQKPLCERCPLSESMDLGDRFSSLEEKPHRIKKTEDFKNPKEQSSSHVRTIKTKIPIRLGCVSYLNAWPLVSFLNPSDFEIVRKAPAELLRLLREKQVEAALLPIVDYFENPDLLLFPDIGISAVGNVETVKLFLTDPNLALSKIQSVQLDSESKSSNLLLKVLLKDHFGLDLDQITFFKEASPKTPDAILKIGDKAFSDQKEGIDLGKIWWDFQKKPFVFAMWMTQKNRKVSRDFEVSIRHSELNDALFRALENGLKNIDHVIEHLQKEIDVLPHVVGLARLKNYFTETIRYRIGQAALDGIKAFYELSKPLTGYPDEFDFRFVS